MDRPAFDERLASLRESRFRLPEIVRNRLQSRHRRPVVGHEARLLLIEADDPARGELGAAGDPLALADRGDLLHRLDTALRSSGVDGVIGTADIIDDLLLLEVLEDHLAIGSMNRGGLPGSAFAHDDRFTGYDAETILNARLDGGKMGLVIDPTDPATAHTVESCSRAVTTLATGGALALVAPDWSRGEAAAAGDDATADLIRAVTVAAGLGSRSPFTWLALPADRVSHEVAAATTLPILLVAPHGSAPRAGAGAASWVGALAFPGVRGVIVPVSALYDSDADVASTIASWVELVRSPAPKAGT